MTVLFVLAFGMVSAPSSGGDALRCGGRLIQPGHTAVTLQRRCGEPAHLLRLPKLLLNTSPLGEVPYTQETIEYWTYAPPEGQLSRLVTVARGKVQSIRVLERLDDVDQNACRRGVIDLGAHQGAVAISCGAPDHQSTWLKTISEQERQRLVTHHRWVYDLGPGRLLRVLEFENGRLMSVAKAERSPND